MSKIAITPNASGTGTVTITSPNTNTDRTLVLPDATGTVNISGSANEVPAGSAGAPAIYPTGDTNTGIFFPSADTVAISTGGTQRLTVDASGNLSVTGTVDATTLSIGGTAITSTAAELNFVDGVTSAIQTQLDAKAPLASPALTGTPTAPTASVGTNTTQVATTAFVNAEIANDITGKADLASPAFTGVPTAPTATVGTNTTQLATTAFVIANAGSLNSPAFTGTPTAPTASVGTNTTQLATTAFVNAEIANDAPTKTGGGASGTWSINVTGSSGSTTGNAATVSSITNITGLTRNSLSAATNLSSLTTSNFRSTLFGSTTSGFNLSAGRWEGTPSALSPLSAYGTMMAWSGSDTHGFLALNYDFASAKIGGGNANTINWSADLITSSNVSSYVANRAWVKFNGSTGGIYGSGGVSSVTYNGTGQSTVNFSTAMPDTNYSAVCSGHSAGFGRQANAFPLYNGFATGSCVIWYGNTINAAAENLTHVNVAFFR